MMVNGAFICPDEVEITVFPPLDPACGFFTAWYRAVCRVPFTALPGLQSVIRHEVRHGGLLAFVLSGNARLAPFFQPVEPVDPLRRGKLSHGALVHQYGGTE